MSLHRNRKRLTGRQRRKVRIRKKIFGTAERPRLSVFRSAKHVYAQVVDDETGEGRSERKRGAPVSRLGLSRRSGG